MYKIIQLLAFIVTVLFFQSCKLDNQETPKLIFSGNFTYNGKPIPLENGILSLKFSQNGYGLVGWFTVSSDQNGKYQNLIFPGEYKVALENGKGAYENNTDTVSISTSKSLAYDWPLKPYFFVNKADYLKNGKNLIASINIEKVSNRELAQVSLLMARTKICDRVNKDKEIIITAKEINDLSKISINTDLSDWKNSSLFVRIGVKSNASSYYNYSEVVKIDL